jgi:predicted acyl esterase
MRFVRAPTWEDLHPQQLTFSSSASGTTSSDTPGPAGAASDPITTATLPLPGAYHGCRIMKPSQVDPSVVTYLFKVSKDIVLMGGPVVDVSFTTTAPDTQLHARLWDVAADGSAQGLIDRGTYRSLDTPGTGAHARFQLTPQGYRFLAGHTLKVEITANDAPYFQQSNVPAVVQVSGLTITLPLLETPGTGQARAVPVAGGTPPTNGSESSRRGALAATGDDSSAGWGALALLTLAAGLLRVRRSGRA